MKIVLPTFYSVATIMSKELGVNINEVSFERSDLIENDNTTTLFDTDILELVSPLESHGLRSLGKFYETFFEKGKGNHRKTIGLRHAAFFLGKNQKQNVARFVKVFGRHSEVMLPIHSFEIDKILMIPVLQIFSEYHWRIQKVVLTTKTKGSTVSPFTRLPIITN